MNNYINNCDADTKVLQNNTVKSKSLFKAIGKFLKKASGNSKLSSELLEITFWK
jgi:hypothetical protein